MNHQTRIPVSIGELIDKITILQIKSRRITEASKLVNIHRELDLLHRVFDAEIEPTPEVLEQMDALRSINESLWEIEDAIRECERAGDFGQRFIELARSVYLTNDRRSEVKRQINRLTGSTLIEEKSYPPVAGAPGSRAGR